MGDKNDELMKWAAFRYGLIGHLVADPPKYGDLKRRIEELASRLWQHPLTSETMTCSFGSVERWYYRALKGSSNPIKVLHNKDRGCEETKLISLTLKEKIKDQYLLHRNWTFKLHHDNIKVVATDDVNLGDVPSYSTFCRFMKKKGYWPKRGRRGRPLTEGQQLAIDRFEAREIRSYEAPRVGTLYHLDFHHGSRRILTKAGEIVTPILLTILDDYSRLCCHAQWYLAEDTQTLVHGFVQALLKRGLCWKLMTDNGSAMISDEFKTGLLSLSIIHDTTLPYSPYQNGKQERLWGQVEGRLIAMLENVKDLGLKQLNESTQAWVEIEYNRSIHSETGQTPCDRFMLGSSQIRPCPDAKLVREAFRLHETRRQRLTDGTVSIGGIRFEIPDRCRHLRKISVRYARWDLSCVDMVDDRSGENIERLYPLDKTANSSSLRRIRHDPLTNKENSDSTNASQESGMAPLLSKYLEDYSSMGILPAYLSTKDEGEN